MVEEADSLHRFPIVERDRSFIHYFAMDRSNPRRAGQSRLDLLRNPAEQDVWRNQNRNSPALRFDGFARVVGRLSVRAMDQNHGVSIAPILRRSCRSLSETGVADK